MTKEELLKKISNDPGWTIGALIAIYSGQEPNERSGQTTIRLNNIGFNRLDARPLSNMAQFYERHGYLTPKQINLVRFKIRKYINQMLIIGVKPHPVIPHNKFDRMTPVQTTKWAGFNKGWPEAEGNRILIKFTAPKSQQKIFTDTLSKVRSLMGRRFNPKDKTWSAYLDTNNVEKLIKWEFEIGEKLMAWYKAATEVPKIPLITNIPIPKSERLYEFQHYGVEFIESRKGKVLIADEMGLGKTIQALAWLSLHPKLRPAIIITPNIVKIKWEREVKKWLPNDVTWPMFGRKAHIPHTATVIIINYDIIKDHHQALQALLPKVLILDESHYIKNRKAQRTATILRLARKTEHILALSGTPIVNRPVEFFNTLRILKPQVFSSFWKYAHDYCGAKHTGFGWDFSGATKTEELNKLLMKTVMIRRLKKDVLKDLPPKTISIVPLEIDNRKEYRDAEENFIEWLIEKEGESAGQRAKQAEILVKTEKLKQLAFEGKKKSVIAWINDFLDSGKKLAVFCAHQKTIDYLLTAYGRTAIRVDGRDDARTKTLSTDTFNQDPTCRLFVANMRAMEGIDLTATSTACFVELPWTPKELDQSSDRVHGIGRGTDDPVIIYYLLAERTIDEDIADLLDEKRKVLDKVLDGKEVEEKHLLIELLKRMRKKGGKDEIF